MSNLRALFLSCRRDNAAWEQCREPVELAACVPDSETTGYEAVALQEFCTSRHLLNLRMIKYHSLDWRTRCRWLPAKMPVYAEDTIELR
jgi:hypothetical protein